ncbi:FkbM family methyltransferase [Sphingomonas histidinilytica]|uniref:FkbM family methyltransferase n=1 Tax=Rhizorhabdus histidinilytica TaxID=439228 RepID=UPI001ADCBAF6|nr:FkbM family methyltransferase [Rhizorhabdus histidinilytica]MBO9378992.1 FkbM family methyltransferase [Rhizorhabdus histidinilytica]
MNTMNLIRVARDYAWSALTFPINTAKISGVKLSLEGASPRMRYVIMRGYESGDAALAAKVLDASDTVLEAGAAIGFMALYCIKNLGIRQYHMVEANCAMEREIKANFHLNGVPCPSLSIAALAAQDGSVSFGVNRDFWSSSILERTGEQRVTVPARSLPSLIAQLGYQPSALIIDIEGGETSIPLEHFALFQKIVIETHRKLVGHEAIDRLMHGLHQKGFRVVAQNGGSYALSRTS